MRHIRLSTVALPLLLVLAGCSIASDTGDAVATSSLEQPDTVLLPNPVADDPSATPTASDVALVPTVPGPIVVPSLIRNENGTVRSEMYDGLAVRSLSDAPYGPLLGGGTIAAFESRTDLIRASQAVVAVDITAISNPRFNSDDGGFWVTPEGQARAVIQNVTVRVVERWGDDLGLPDEFTFVAFGGGVEVELSDEQARAIELEKGGKYIFSTAPDFDLTVGDRVVLFLALDGLGWEGGLAPGLVVVGAGQGKFDFVGDSVAPATRPEWEVSTSDIRAEIARDLGKNPPVLQSTSPPADTNVYRPEPGDATEDLVDTPDHTHGED